ncbi:hypothetical protein TRVL_06466 [Trypanosoma vivax]|nr:hypothetical protein TRVL_06466 [Trypanosoma vivax]
MVLLVRLALCEVSAARQMWAAERFLFKTQNLECRETGETKRSLTHSSYYYKLQHKHVMRISQFKTPNRCGCTRTERPDRTKSVASRRIKCEMEVNRSELESLVR